MADRSEYKTSQTYLSRHYFDDAKLREFAVDEFMRCMRSRKMVAFVGSMASKNLDYPDWKGLFDLTIRATKDYLESLELNDPNLQEKLDAFSENLRKELEHNHRFDGRVLASVLGLWLDNATLRDDSGDRINEGLARLLETECTRDLASYTKESSIIKNLKADLGIKNFITTNYDLEIEFVINGCNQPNKAARYAALRKVSRVASKFTIPDKSLLVPNSAVSTAVSSPDKVTIDTTELHRIDTESISIKLPDGNQMVADAFNRDRLDRLIEFSIGSADIDYHILHLHGHLWRPRSMIVSYRDYDRLYRRSGASKHPFEQTLSLLYSSNPIVFVGLGMSEGEINSALEELVGNQPFKGTGRRFLLWNAPEDLYETCNPQSRVLIPASERKQHFRLEKLHKLGVLTIFDDELDKEINDAGVNEADREVPQPVDDEQRLALLIKKLGIVNDYRRRKMRKADYGPSAWRQVEFRSQLLEGEQARPEPVRFTWQFVREIETDHVVAQQSAFKDLKPADWSMRVVTSRPGTQKGTQAEVAVLAWSHPICDAAGQLVADPNRPSMLVNASLRLDTDSMLEGLCQFLCQSSGIDRETGKKPKGAKGGAKPVGISRETLFDQGRLFRPVAGKKPLIVFRGLERLFSKSGVPLSAELDNFFRNYLLAAIEAKKSGEPKRLCRIIVFGSRRVRVYFRELQRLIEREIDAASKARKRLVVRPKSILVIERFDDSPSGYLIWQSSQFRLPGYTMNPPWPHEVTSEVPLAEDRAFAKRTYERLFSSKRFLNTFEANEDRNLAFAIMTVMAFIGQPVEQCVLLHVPRIIEALDLQGDKKKGWKQGLSRLDKIFKSLRDLNLVNEIGKPTIRPSSGVSPNGAKKEYHSPRYALHKSLQIEFRERYGVPLSEAALSTSFNMSLYAAQPADSVLPEPEVHDELGKMIDWLIGAHKDVARIKGISDADPDKIRQCRAAPEAAAALRAGLAILRGFYSTTALLSLDLDDRLVSERRDGALTEHADRIERLIRSFELMAKERFDFDNALIDEGKSQAERSEALGPGPIYKDELVWLHNERGVVKLAQGDLYEARHSFDAADQINRKYVEFGCRSHNWRRIWLNQLAVDFERGKLTEAEDRIGRIEASLHSAEEIETIRRVLSTLPAGAQPLLPLHVSHEDCLAVALTTGYRALIQFQRGELPDSERMFRVAIAMLQSLDEQRACALMRRYFASLLWVMEGVDEMSKMAKLAGAGAESYQQMDIVYAARIIKHHKHAISERADDRLVAMRTFARALDFATQTDLHRVAIEARRSLAGLKLQNGDYESALEHARIAMALAGRYGFVLFKISIRILLGRILIARDNEVAGMSLIRNAISQADRIGYQRGIDAAQFAIQSLVRGR